MNELIGNAIQRLADRQVAGDVRREISTRLAVERLVLELRIRAPWLEPAERRQIAERAVRAES